MDYVGCLFIVSAADFVPLPVVVVSLIITVITATLHRDGKVFGRLDLGQIL